MANGVILKIKPDLSDIKNLDSLLKNALETGNTKLAQLIQNFQKSSAAVSEQSAKVDELKSKLEGLKSGDVEVRTKGLERIDTQYEKTRSEIVGIEQEIEKLNALPYANAEKIEALNGKLQNSKEKAAALSNEFNVAFGNETQKEISATESKLQDAERKLKLMSTQSEIVGEKLRQSSSSGAELTESLSKGFDKVTSRISGLIKRVFFFSLITMGLRKLRTAFMDVAMSDENFRNSVMRLQAALWVAFTPIMQYIIPALQTLISWLTAALTAISRFIAFITGKSYSSMVDNAKGLKAQSDAYKKLGKNSGAAAKGMKKATDEAEKQLAAFDDLKILSENKTAADSGGGASGGGGGAGASDFEFGMKDKIDAELNAIMGIAGATLVAIGLILLFTGNIGWGIGFIIAGAALVGASIAAFMEQEFQGKIGSQLAAIMAVASISLLAIGLILLALGNIGWGIGFIVAGALILGVSQQAIKSGALDNEAKKLLIGIMLAAGAALLAIGIILLCFGVVPIGIALIVAGAASLAGAVSVDTEYVKNTVATFLKENEGLIIGVALVVLGIILCFAQATLPLGIGMIAVGAVTLAEEVGVDWELMKNKISDFFKNNAGIIVGVSIALLVIGLILCFTQVALPLGIGLIAAGAVILGKEAQLNWDIIKEKISTAFDAALNWVKGWGLLILGIILTASGVGIGLGLQLMKEGGANLTEAQDPMWNTITEKVKEVWGNIKRYWQNNIAKYFTAQWWADLGRTAINGLIRKIVEGLNSLIGKLNNFGFDLPDALGGAHIGFNIKKLSVPQLARGAVIPPNRKFLAVLGDQKSGTNIETPLATMVEAFNVALQNYQGSGTNEIILELDGRELGRAIIEQGNKEIRRIGPRLVIT